MKLTPEQVIERAKYLDSERSNWNEHWQELADYILPTKNNITKTRSNGEKVQAHLLDNTGSQSNVLLSGFLHGLLTNPNSQFFELTTGQEEIDERDDVRLWLQQTSRKILHVLNNSNFQTEVHEAYIDLGCFGTSVMSMEEDEQSVVRFNTRPIRGCMIDEDYRGHVCEVYRKFELNAKQLVQQFGEEILEKSRQVKASYGKKGTEKFWVYHAVYKKSDTKNSAMPYIDQYILECDKIELKSGGFKSFPYATPRWLKHAGEKYGRSPGMVALPELKTLNLMTEVTIKGAQKMVDPPLQAPDDGFIGTLRTRPGAINFKRPGTEDVKPIFNDSRIDFGFQVIEDRRQRIRDAYFVDQLKLRDGKTQMTATEVEARVEQSLRFMGPILGRMQSEFLRPIIDRVYEIMEAREMIDPAPVVLRQIGRLDVNYSSIIARTQRQQESQAILKTIEQSAPFISADPSVLDNFDGNVAVRKLARANSFPQEIFKSEREVKQIRASRAEQKNLALQEELKQNTASNISKVAPALSVVPGGGQSVG